MLLCFLCSLDIRQSPQKTIPKGTELPRGGSRPSGELKSAGTNHISPWCFASCIYDNKIIHHLSKWFLFLNIPCFFSRKHPKTIDLVPSNSYILQWTVPNVYFFSEGVILNLWNLHKPTGPMPRTMKAAGGIVAGGFSGCSLAWRKFSLISQVFVVLFQLSTLRSLW